VLRIGLLGVGDAGTSHARALAAAHGTDIAWAAVGARDVVKSAAKCRELGMPESTRVVSPDELLAGELCDAVIIATPDGMHHDHALLALRASMHVLVEKPLALTLIDASDLVAAARDGGRVLQVGYHLRHHAGHELVHAHLAELVGEPRTIHARWAWPDPAVDGWRARGEGARWWSLAALGTHAIDLALWLTGAPVVEAVSVREPPQGIDRAAEVSLRFATGVLAHLSVSVRHRARSVLSVTGDAGEVICEATLGARGAGTITHRRGIGTGGTSRFVAFPIEDPYLRQLRAFARRCGEEHGKIDAHAITNLELLHRVTPA
jgi:predicted dehydrogenase